MTSSTITILGDRLELTAQPDGAVFVRLTGAQRLGCLTGLAVPAGDLRAALDEVAPPAVAQETIESLTRARDGAEKQLAFLSETYNEVREQHRAEVEKLRTQIPDPSDPDVIEQAARRAREAFVGDRSPGPMTKGDLEFWSDAIRAAFSALTSPPARDPKVDELKAILVDFWTEASDDDWTEEECAVYLASRGVRVEGGEG